MNHYYVGDVLEDAGRGAEALVEYREAFALTEALVALDPTNASWQLQRTELRETVDTCCR